MTKPELKPSDPIDFVIGSLDPERRAVLDVVRSQNADLDRDISSLEAGLIPLFNAIPPEAPPPDLWAALESQLDTLNLHQDQLDIDLFEAGVWATTGEGVRSKMLWDGRSVLIHCQPGASIPEHEHWAEERILVLQGDVCFGDRDYGPGDAISMKKGTHHGITTTTKGCLFLLSYAN